MNVAWGVVVTFLALLAWAGQAISWLAPSAAVRWKLMEAEEDVEPDLLGGRARRSGVGHVDAVDDGLGRRDADPRCSAWPYSVWSAVGSICTSVAVDLYRLAMLRRDLRIGAPDNVRLGFVLSAAWAAMAHLHDRRRDPSRSRADEWRQLRSTSVSRLGSCGKEARAMSSEANAPDGTQSAPQSAPSATST